MNKMLHRFGFVLSLVFIAINFVKCTKADTPALPAAANITITSFTPQTGYSGFEVEIDGINFSAVKEKNIVAFNGAVATVHSASATQLLVNVPDSITTGKITVTVDGKTVASATDFIRPALPTPTIRSVQWMYGRAGDTVAIFGTNFLTARTFVRFNGIKAEVLHSSPAQLAVVVPQWVTTGKIAVNVMGEVIVTSSNFTVLPPVTSMVTTFAGSAIQGHADGAASLAQFDHPTAVAMDVMGNLYVGEGQNERYVRKITSSGNVSTVATFPIFNSVSGIAITSSGIIYVSDAQNHIIRKILPTGEVSVFAGSYGRSGYLDGYSINARFNFPSGLALDGAGSLLVADYYNGLIRKITPDGIVSTFAGKDTSSKITAPHALAMDQQGNLFVANSKSIFKISPSGQETFIAGGNMGFFTEGYGADATFYSAAGITVDKNGNIFVGDGNYNRIRKVTPEGLVYTIAGTGNYGYVNGKGLEAEFSQPGGVVADPAGNVFVADGNSVIRKITF